MKKIDFTQIFGKTDKGSSISASSLSVFFDKNILEIKQGPAPSGHPASNEIWYWGEYYDMEEEINDLVEEGASYGDYYGGPNILSNEFDGEKWVIIFDGDVTQTGYVDGSKDKRIYYPLFGVCDVTKVEFGSALTDVNGYSFSRCPYLTELVLPNSVQQLGTINAHGPVESSIMDIDCPDLTVITYLDTKSQWNSIEKAEYWDNNQITLIHCTDGDITSSSNMVYVYIDDISTMLDSTLSYRDQGYDVLYVQNTYRPGSSPSDYTYNIDAYPQSGDNFYTYCNESSISAILTYGNGNKDYIINRTYIDEYDTNPFKNDNIVSVVVTDYVTEIDSHAFSEWNNLITMDLSNSSVTRIKYDAISNCSLLESITFPDCLVNIDEGACRNNPKITSIVLPASISTFENDILNINTVTCLAIVPPTSPGGNTPYPSCEVVYVPTESVNAYKSAVSWTNVSDRIQAIPEIIS